MPSEAIRYFHYDPAKRELKVGFRPRGDYIYEDVPAEEIAALQAARSKGTYINQVIKRRYRFRRADPRAA